MNDDRPSAEIIDFRQAAEARALRDFRAGRLDVVKLAHLGRVNAADTRPCDTETN